MPKFKSRAVYRSSLRCYDASVSEGRPGSRFILWQAYPMVSRVKFWFSVVITAGRHWNNSQAFVYAAALAFFTVFSIAPVVIVAVGIVGLVLGEQAAQGQIMEQLQGAIGPQAAEFVQSAVAASRMDKSGIWPSILGIATILVGATTVFAQMQRSLNDIWSVAPKPSKSSVFHFMKNRLLSLTLVLSIGFILLVSLLLSVGIRATIVFAESWLVVPPVLLVALEVILSLVMVTLLFGAIFQILPDVVLRWKDVFVGAAVTAVLFTIGRSLIALYLANTATSSTYGAAGSLVLLLLWVNYSSLILLYGAAFTRAQLEAGGRVIIPRNTAVRIHKEIVED